VCAGSYPYFPPPFGGHCGQHLDLFEYSSVTDGGLGAVAAGCPNLRHLGLCSCGSVTDGGAALFPNADVVK